MSTPVATLLPLSSLPGFQGAIDFLCWLDKTHQQGWQMLPISGPIEQPYRNQGIGVASFFYDHQVPQKYRTWLLTYHDFLTANQDWLLDFALYQALSEHYQTICYELILAIINKLNAAGAEAISLNEERYVLTSHLEVVEGQLKMNNTVIKMPVVIKAIGDMDTLEAAMNFRYDTQ